MSEEAPVQWPAIKITSEIVSKAIVKIKSGKAAGYSGIIMEIIESMNGLFKVLPLCMTMLIRKSESQTAIATQLAFQ